MSILRNLLGDFMPHFEARSTTGTLAAINSEVIHNLSGDESVVIYLNGAGSFAGTYFVEGSADGVNYFSLLCFPYNSSGGLMLLPSQPIFSEAATAAMIFRTLCAAVGGLKKVRVRLSAYVSGSCSVTVNSEAAASINPYVRDQKSNTQITSATGLVGTAVTATLPAVSGLRHYLDRIDIVRSATAALVSGATPVVITTTNLPGPLAFSLGSDTGGVGVDKTIAIDFGSSGLATNYPGIATTVIAPAYAGVIWRINVIYRLGL